MSKKILVSPGYGAGFATWNSNSKAVAEYQPLVEFIENGGDPKDLDRNHEFDEDGNVVPDRLHPLIRQMAEDLGVNYICTLGCAQLRVVEVNGPYRIDEYDGFESVTTADDLWED